MAIRELLERHRQGFTIGGVVVTLLMIGVIFYETYGGGPSVGDSFFTADDGRTWFTESATQISPFDYHGGQAVRCFVFRTPSGTEFVAYEEKVSDEVLAIMNPKKAPAAAKPKMMTTGMGGMLIKKPGEANWRPFDPMTLPQLFKDVVGPDGSKPCVQVQP